MSTLFQILLMIALLGGGVLMFCMFYFAMGPARTDRQRRYKKRLDNIFTARTREESWRSLVTPADRYEASAATRIDVARIRAEERER